MKTLTGALICGTIEKIDQYDWTDPATNQVKPIRSIKLLVAHGDGTVTRESITIPAGMRTPDLRIGTQYAIPCTVSLNKKRQQVTYAVRADIQPFPAPEID